MPTSKIKRFQLHSQSVNKNKLIGLQRAIHKNHLREREDEKRRKREEEERIEEEKQKKLHEELLKKSEVFDSIQLCKLLHRKKKLKLKPT